MTVITDSHQLRKILVPTKYDGNNRAWNIKPVLNSNCYYQMMTFILNEFIFFVKSALQVIAEPIPICTKTLETFVID